MKKKKIRFLIAIIFSCAWLLSGCWNYREVDKLAIVSGVAIDKDDNGKIIATVEIVSMQQANKQSSLKPIYIQAAGDTFFEAIRSMVAIDGKRLYWSHAKVVIVSEKIAKEGVSRVLDFMKRDAEVREDLWILLSREKTADAIFNVKPEYDDILSFQIDNTLRAQDAVSRYPAVTLYEFFDMLESKETSSVITTIKLIENKGKTTTCVSGTAVIKKNKLAGYLNEIETRSMLWVQDKLKGGLYAVKKPGGTDTNVSLEIFKSKTKLKPEVKGNNLIMNISLTVDVNIGEILGNEDFISEKGRGLLKKEAEKQIKKDLENLITKAQKEYKSDFLGFGEKINHSMPGIWKSIQTQWDEIYPDMETKVDVNVRIKGSATTKKPIKIGE